MKYLIDSNIFITPHRSFAPIGVAVSLWTKIHEFSDRGIIFSLDMVKDELYMNDDELKVWVKSNMPSDFFLKFGQDVAVAKLSEIMNWADKHPDYSRKAKDKFLRMDKADIYLAAFTAAYPNEYTVVSFERSNHMGSSDIKLPDVCTQFGVRRIPLEAMFRELHEIY